MKMDKIQKGIGNEDIPNAFCLQSEESILQEILSSFHQSMYDHKI